MKEGYVKIQGEALFGKHNQLLFTSNSIIEYVCA